MAVVFTVLMVMAGIYALFKWPIPTLAVLGVLIVIGKSGENKDGGTATTTAPPTAKPKAPSSPIKPQAQPTAAVRRCEGRDYEARLLRARTESFKIITMQGEAKAAADILSKSSGKVYHVTMTSCECEDFKKGHSPCKHINAMSNGEYKMPCVGQVVSVAHSSNGTAAGTTTGTVWNKTNKPAEGYKGLYRKEYGTSRKGQAYSRYDENTGVYTQYVDKRTGRTCNGEIFDEAKGPVSVIAGGQLQLKSSGASASIQAKTGMGIVAGTTVAIEAGTFMSLEATGAMSISAGGDFKFNIGGDSEEKRKGTTKQEYLDDVEQEVTGDVKQTMTGNLEQTVTGDVKQTITGTVTRNVTGDVTLSINGASITISAGGDISITSPTKVEVSAPVLNAEGASGDVKVQSISLVQHKHTSAAPGSESSQPLP